MRRPGHDRGRPVAARGRDQRGAATAELALTIPLLVAVTAGLVWLLAVGVAQVRVVDAARETARAVARGESESASVGRGREVAPTGASVVVSREDGRVVARVSATVGGPGGLFDFLPGAEVSAEAVTLDEEVGP